jgi:hypothetical protein
MSFDIGQRVVCVRVDFSREPVWRGAIRVFPKLNSIYTVRSVRKVGPLIGLCFREMVHAPAHFAEGFVEPAFDSRRFRPLRTTSIDRFRQLLRPVDLTPNRAPELV